MIINFELNPHRFVFIADFKQVNVCRENWSFKLFLKCNTHRHRLVAVLETVTIVTKKRKDRLETRAELAVLRTYVENQAILEPILLYQASKCKQTKE